MLFRGRNYHGPAALPAFTREMGALLNGMRVEEIQFKADVSRPVKGTQASAAAKKTVK